MCHQQERQCLRPLNRSALNGSLPLQLPPRVRNVGFQGAVDQVRLPPRY